MRATMQEMYDFARARLTAEEAWDGFRTAVEARGYGPHHPERPSLAVKLTCALEALGDIDVRRTQ